MEQKLRESGYLLNMEEEEVEAEHVGGLQRRQPRPTKNFEDSTVSAVLVSAGISTAGSNISTITDEEQEPIPEPVYEQAEQHEPDDSFQVDVEHLVSNASPSDGHPVAALGERDGAVAEGNDGKGTGEVGEEELKISVPFEKEHGSAHEHQEAEHGHVGFIDSKMDLIYEQCDLTADKLNVQEDLIKNFHEIRDHGVGISTSWKVPVDGVVCDLMSGEVLSPLSDDHENFSDAKLPSPRKSYQEETAITFIEEVEPEEAEYDVEGVLKKQNTHELFCPNCHSCITRKVILRRRRKVLRFPTGGRGGRVMATSGRSGVESIAEAGDRSPDVAFATLATDAPPDATEGHGKDGEPEVFRCLSCLTFFIPTGDGFKLFRIFEKRREAGTIPESQELPAAVATEKTSFLSFFQWKKKPAVLEGSDAPDAASENKTEGKSDSGMEDDSLLNGRSSSVLAAESPALSKQLPSEKDAILEPKKVEQSSPDSFSKDTANSHKEPPSIISDQFNNYRQGSAKNLGSSSPDTANSLKEPLPVITDKFNTYLGEPPAENGRNLEDVVTKLEPAEVIAPLNSVSIVIGQSIISIDQTTVKETEKDLPVKNELSVVTEVSSLSQSQSSTAESKVVVADSLIFPSPLEKLTDDVVKEPEEPIKKSTGDGVIVEIERAPASQTTPTGDALRDVENPPQVDTQTPPSETRTAEVPEARDFDILKSIVYGGLVESIASLGVVSSAAGGGAATLNTFALALANLITGLFVLVHNIRELKNEQSSGAETQPDVEGDRYYQQLGRRGKFSLHLSIAVVSYLVFGLVAPITYGFSFRESDDRDYKLAVVAAASLLCILLLALTKAHVRSKSYIKTALYYLVMGFAASGISFLVGELVDKLLERLGLFDSASSSTLVSGGLREMPLPVSWWASY